MPWSSLLIHVSACLFHRSGCAFRTILGWGRIPRKRNSVWHLPRYPFTHQHDWYTAWAAFRLSPKPCTTLWSPDPSTASASSFINYSSETNSWNSAHQEFLAWNWLRWPRVLGTRSHCHFCVSIQQLLKRVAMLLETIREWKYVCHCLLYFKVE